MKRRLVMAVMCVPMPPCFLGLPLRQMMLPFIGRLPVNSQIRAIKSFNQWSAKHSIKTPGGKHYFSGILSRHGRTSENGLGFPGRLPLSLARMNLNPSCRHPSSTLFLAVTLPSSPLPSRAVAAEVAPPRPGAGMPPATVARTDAVANSVVKVFSTMRYPDLYKPWTKQSPSDATGSGVVIEGKRILTNAHVVLYASQVQVQANQAGDKISATVEAIAPGIDLAVLKLDDETFFDTHPPLAARENAAGNQGRGHGLWLSRGRHQPFHHQGHRFAHRV